ncbi:MAG TPA: hypothetical protein VF282_07840 [Bacillota bacterium]
MVPESSPELTEGSLKALARVDVVHRGQHLFLSRRVHDLTKEGDVVAGRVEGSTGSYRVRLHVQGRSWSCSCSKVAGLHVERAEQPWENDACKHVIALGYAWILTPQLFRESAEQRR